MKMCSTALILLSLGTMSLALRPFMGLDYGVSQVSIQSTTRPPATGYGTLLDGAKVWGDTPLTTFVEVPAWLSGLHLAKPNKKVQKGVTLFWDCSNSAGCACFVFQYRCSGCDFADGGLESVLAGHTKDWEKLNCAPKFTNDYGPGGEAHHPMIAFRTQANDKERVEVTLAADTEYILLGGDNDNFLAHCGDKKDEAACEAIGLKGQCEWDDLSDKCGNRRCIPKWKGPSNGGQSGGSQGPMGGLPGGSFTCAKRCADLDYP